LMTSSLFGLTIAMIFFIFHLCQILANAYAPEGYR
jgi:hypothetical protein